MVRLVSACWTSIGRDLAPCRLLALALALDFGAVAMLGLDRSLAPAARPAWVLADALEGRMEIYQAQGVVVVQLSVGPAEAMVRLRAHAYAEDRRSPPPGTVGRS